MLLVLPLILNAKQMRSKCFEFNRPQQNLSKYHPKGSATHCCCKMQAPHDILQTKNWQHGNFSGYLMARIPIESPADHLVVGTIQTPFFLVNNESKDQNKFAAIMDMCHAIHF